MIFVNMANEAKAREGSLQPEHSSAGCLPWDRFSAWIHCVCVVTFDLEIGQAMEVS